MEQAVGVIRNLKANDMEFWFMVDVAFHLSSLITAHCSHQGPLCKIKIKRWRS